MTASRTDDAGSASPLNDLPQFDLDFDLDDPVDPSAVTVYDGRAEDNTTTWITVDVAHAIDLADVP